MTRTLLATALVAVVAGCSAADDAASRLRMVRSAGGEWFELTGADPAAVESCAGHLEQVFQVRVAEGLAGETPPMLGTHAASGGTIRFTPRFPLSPGVTYRATVDGARLGGGPVLTRLFTVPPSTAPRVRVERVYPSGDVLPENNLRFYVQFSGPIARGQIYRHTTLRDDTEGAIVELPFLEIAEELWDPSGTRLTLLVDPGRIKNELRPRLEAGPVFQAGHRYTLTIAADCADRDGRPLLGAFTRRFRIEAPDQVQPDPARWTLSRPRVGTRDPLEVQFGDGLDHALLHRMITVVGPGDQPVSGAIQVSGAETRWQFRPDREWTRAAYRLEVDSELEDRAGNSIRSPFEVDVVRDRRPGDAPRFVRLPLVLR